MRKRRLEERVVFFHLSYLTRLFFLLFPCVAVWYFGIFLIKKAIYRDVRLGRVSQIRSVNGCAL